MRSRSALNLGKKITNTNQQGVQVLLELQQQQPGHTINKRKKLQQPHKQREKEQAIPKQQKKHIIMFL